MSFHSQLHVKYNQLLAGLSPERLAPSIGTLAPSDYPPTQTAKVLPAQDVGPSLPQLQHEPVPLRQRAGVSSQASPLQPGEANAFLPHAPVGRFLAGPQKPRHPDPHLSAPRETERRRF